MDYIIEFNLLRIKGVYRKGKKKGKRYIVIPESDDVVIGKKGAYCKFVAQRHKKPHPRGYSHYIKPYVDYDEYCEMSKTQFQYLTLVEKLRDTLLEDYKMYMRNSRGEGYVIVNPNDQTTIAYKKLVKDVSGSIREAKTIMYNVRDVPAEQKAKDDDLRAKIGIMEQMFNNLK